MIEELILEQAGYFAHSDPIGDPPNGWAYHSGDYGLISIYSPTSIKNIWKKWEAITPSIFCETLVLSNFIVHDKHLGPSQEYWEREGSVADLFEIFEDTRNLLKEAATERVGLLVVIDI